MNVIALPLIYSSLLETKERTLEELDHVFAVPTTQHMNYQWGTVLLWWIKRYVFMQESAQCPDLYHLSTSEDTSSQNSRIKV